MDFGTVELSDLIETAPGRFALRLQVLEDVFDEVSEVAFFVKDAEGRYLSVNRSLAERHGFEDKAQVIGKRPVDLCAGPFGEVPAAQDQLVIGTGRALVNHLEMQWYRPERPCWCLTTKVPLRKNGKIVGLVGISRDLQERMSPSDVPASVALVLERVETEGAADRTPASLAKESGLSVARFARTLKRIYGMTPSQYLAKARLNEATSLLRETDRSIAEVAVEVGFSDHSAFSRAFRQATGMTPSEFRASV